MTTAPANQISFDVSNAPPEAHFQLQARILVANRSFPHLGPYKCNSAVGRKFVPMSAGGPSTRLCALCNNHRSMASRSRLQQPLWSRHREDVVATEPIIRWQLLHCAQKGNAVAVFSFCNVGFCLLLGRGEPVLHAVLHAVSPHLSQVQPFCRSLQPCPAIGQ